MMSGELPGWKEVSLEDGTEIECYLRFGMSQALPETAEDLKR